MKVFFILCIVITTTYLIYYFRYHLRYFFSLIFYTNKNKNNLNKLKKEGLKERRITNEKVKELVEFAREKLAEKSFFVSSEFKVDKELERHLLYSRFSEKYLNELLCKILEHIQLDKNDIDFSVEYLSSRKTYGYVGGYTKKKENSKAKILIIVKNDMSFDTVISTLAHECTHHLLFTKNIEIEDKKDNECLTDITTILIGFGKYMVKGSGMSNRVTYDEGFMRYVDKNSVGYLSPEDVKYVLKKYKKLF